jgi:hypothetical protein
VNVGDTVHFTYQSSYYQNEKGVNSWHDGMLIDATVYAVLGNAVMILPWNTGREMLVPYDVLRKD